MGDAGLPVNEDQVVYGAYTLSDGEIAANTLLLHKDRPTAVLCFSDEIALGCMFSLRQHGLDVPGDISVMGFDNVPFSRYCTPPLTTIAQPTEDIGATCATILLDLIEGKKPTEIQNILPHELLVRESTRRLN